MHDDDVPENPDERYWADELADEAPPLAEEVPLVDDDLLLPVNAEDTASGEFGGAEFPLEAPEED